MSDMEDEIVAIADEIAEKQYDGEFYDLDDKLQSIVYQRATQEWHDRQSAKAEALEDR